MTDKQRFFKILGGLKQQWIVELKNQNVLTSVYGEDSHIPMHNIDELATPLVEVMASMVAMPDDDAMDEIHRYMHVLNYGTVPGADVRSSEDLWDALHAVERAESKKSWFEEQIQGHTLMTLPKHKHNE